MLTLHHMLYIYTYMTFIDKIRGSLLNIPADVAQLFFAFLSTCQSQSEK